MTIKPIDIIHMIDVSCLKPEVDEDTVIRTCEEAKKYDYAAVFAMSSWLPLVAKLLKGSNTKVGASIGFPLGSHATLIKVFESRDAIASGAEELDMVMNVGAMKSKKYDLVEKDVHAVVEAAEGRIVKVILENCVLTDDEKRLACQIIEKAGADFVKTSTGFAKGGATVEDVRLMRASISPNMRIKAAGAVHTYEQTYALAEAGAVRFGTSNGLAIVKGALGQ